MPSGPKYHGWTHYPDGTDPSKIGWNDPETSSDIGLANIIQFGDGLVVTDEGDGVIRVDAFAGALPFNLGELGFTGDGTLDDTLVHTIDFQDVREGDGIMVAAMAPSRPSSPAPLGIAFDCQDSAGNTYYTTYASSFEDSTFPVVNDGVYLQFFMCDASVAPLVDGTDTITVSWTNDVYDRFVIAWIVRHDGGASPPVRLARTANGDAAVYAAGQVTLQSPTYTPSRDNGLALACIVTAKAGGVGGFGGVGGYTGYYQAKFHLFTGSKQTYYFNCQTFGADSYTVASDSIPTPYEIDLGALPGGVSVSAFNGVGQLYTSGTNAWKGIVIFDIS